MLMVLEIRFCLVTCKIKLTINIIFIYICLINAYRSSNKIPLGLVIRFPLDTCKIKLIIIIIIIYKCLITAYGFSNKISFGYMYDKTYY